MLKNKIKINSSGISLIEIIVSVAIFATLSMSIYGVFTSIIKGITYYREKTIISSLANQYLEIVRNMPYSQVATKEGNPRCPDPIGHPCLPDEPNPLAVNFYGNNYQIYYTISYIDDPADGTAPNDTDYKQVKLYIKNIRTGVTNSFLTNVAPKGLEGLVNGGALSLKVFDAVGQPVSGATLHIVNENVTPNIDLTRTTDSNGNWIEVGLPNSVNNYNITASKTGYSSDKTYPISSQNPNPLKPDATISNSQITQISFLIDKSSSLTFNTLSKTCAPIQGVGVEVRGSKLIGTSPDVLKFDNFYTSNSNGKIPIYSIEWDNYTPALTGSDYMIYGSSPIQQVNILPGTIQNFNLILGPATANSLLVIVKDASTGNPLEGVKVDLQLNGQIYTGFANGSVWGQQNWSGGGGQTDFVDSAKYYEDDSNIGTNEIPSGLRLKKMGADYVSFGSLTSSVFDTGTDFTSFTILTWQPTSQDPATNIKFQIAASNTNNDETVWNYLGPDGTNSTYYTIPGTTITGENNNRYIRYKAFLSTADTLKTPVLTSININYVSGCFSPGQIMFPGLQKDTGYQATVSMAGYQTQTINNINIDGYNILNVLLSH